MHRTYEKTILVVEDTLPQAKIYEEYLLQNGYGVVIADTGKKAMSVLDAEDMPAAVVLDLILPDMNGLEILERVHSLYPKLPVIIVTVNNSVDVAAQATRMGAYDFIVKPFPAARLTVTLHNALERKALATEVEELRQVTGLDGFHNFVGQSPAMQAIYRVIDGVASSKASVFIHGESGTGKEMAAHAIHKASLRRGKAFVPLNCAAIPRELMESIIFGHVKGAFTGAVSDQPGAARMAHGGTLFLDEICDMPIDLQTKLLRFAQTGEVTAVGGSKTENVDVRFIAATNRDPRVEVAARRFREDLFYRLHIVPVEMPALRDREDDVLLLASHFLARFGAEENRHFTGLSPEVASLFRRYDWPGNVRQLENVIRNVVVLNDGPTVMDNMLPKDLKLFAEESPVPAANQNGFGKVELTTDAADASGAIKPLWLLEKNAIMGALDFTEQDITRAAAMLEVSPSTLYRKLQVWRAVAV